MKRILILFLALFLLPILHGCYYDNLEEIHPGIGMPENCDTLGTVSFATEIQPILNTNCGTSNSGCHQVNQPSNGSYGLSNWADVTSTINNPNLFFMKSITHDPSLDPTKWMPKGGGQLSSCSILKIQAWINRGSNNN